jgi:hypothetical protein
MSLELKTRKLNGVLVIDLNGRITLEKARYSIHEMVRDKLRRGLRKILLNLA